MSSPSLEAKKSGKSCPAAFRLPPEIVKTICEHTSNSTIKNLRLTCRFFLTTAALRLDRVFISASSRNLEVFKAIADHEVLRTQITEIIWDDALLYEGPLVPRDESEAYYDDDYDPDDYIVKDGVPGWFRKACKENIADLGSLEFDDIETPSYVEMARRAPVQMPMGKAWAHYQELLEQQREILDSKAHIHSLEDHIGSFPALRRITITPAVHGRLSNPLYETPMIRSFPRGFNYYLPQSWPVIAIDEDEYKEWDDDGCDWQGFRAVMRLLAENKDSGNVTDLRIDAETLETGLNSGVFERENRTFTDFEMVLARPNFKQLQLDLLVNPFSRQAEVFHHGFLKRALDGASGGQGLEYMSLRAVAETQDGNYHHEWNVPLKRVFTSTNLSRLRHLGLSSFYVNQDDLLALLASLPQTLRTVELSFLKFADDKASYQTLLWRIRDTLDWKYRNPRPTLAVGIDVRYYNPGQAIWLEDELYSFLYQDGSNPFGDDPAEMYPDDVKEGFGWVKDAFDREHEHPHVGSLDIS